MSKSELSPRVPRRALRWPDTLMDIQDALRDTDVSVYVVGGAVRDAHIGLPLHDIDLATPGDSIKLGKQIANRLDGDFFVLDSERGVARALLDTADGQLVIDVARLRGPDLAADLRDRDFTFNAMAVALHDNLERLIDPLDGEDDLLNGIVRRCSTNSIADDPIRALRAIRMSVAFKSRVEPATLADVRANSDRLLDVSAERVRDEFFKMLSLRRPLAALRVVDRLGLLARVLPETVPLKGVMFDLPGDMDAWERTLRTTEKLSHILETISSRRTDRTASVFDMGMIAIGLDRFRAALQAHTGGTWPDERHHEALLLLAALLHTIDAIYPGDDLSGIIQDRADALRLSGDERKRLMLVILNYRIALSVETDDLSLHRYWQRYGPAGIDMILLALANHLGMVGPSLSQDEWIKIVEHAQAVLDAYVHRYETVVAPPPLLDGKALMQALDMSPGRHVGILLTTIQEAQVTGDVQTREDAVELARQRAREMGLSS